MFEPGHSISIDDIINASEKLGAEVDEPKKAVEKVEKEEEPNEYDKFNFSNLYGDKPSFS